MKAKYQALLAEILILIAVALWGSSFALTKPLLDVMGVFTFMGARFLTGGILLGCFLILFKKLTLTKDAIKGGFITGALLFAGFIFHTYGLKYTSIAKNAFIVGSNVIFVPMILSVLYHKKQSKSVWFSTIFALIGLALVTLDGKQTGLNKGDVITLIGTLILCFYILKVEIYTKKGDPLTIATVQILTVGLMSLVPACIFESPLAYFSSSFYSPLVIGNLAILSIGCTSIAYLISNYGQSHISAARASLLYIFEPIFGAFLGWLLLGEVVGLQGMIGATLIVLSTIIPPLLNELSLRKHH